MSAIPRSSRGLLVAWVVFLLSSVLLVVVLLQLRHDLRLVARLQQDLAGVRAGLSVTQGAPSLPAVRALRQDLEHLDGEAQLARRWLGGPARLLARQTIWPEWHAWGLVADGALTALTDVTTTAWWMALAAESATEHAQAASAAPDPAIPSRHTDALAASLWALRANRERLGHAREALSQADEGLQALARHPFGGARLAASASRTLDLASLSLQALRVLPQFLATEDKRTVLVLIQNSDELRATGGFISAVVVLRFEGYRLDSLRYMNSYEVEAYRQIHPAPPTPVQQYMQTEVLLFRDANWSPDFPTSAEVLASLFQSDMGEPVDGLVAIDTRLAQLVFAALGPLPLPRYNVTVTADNVLETTIAFWDQPLDAPTVAQRHEQWDAWLTHRKDFGGALVEAGRERLARLSLQDVVHLGQALQQGVRGKHIMLWALNDPALQADLRQADLDGRLRDVPRDYVMVVDSNVGWNKVDRHIERRIRYDVTLTNDGPRGRLCLEYRNLAAVPREVCVHQSQYEDSYEALTEQCYWNYVRAFVPWGTTLLAVQGAEHPVDLDSEGNKTSFGTLVVVPPGQSRTLCLEYALPPQVVQDLGRGRRAYTLSVQKQSGTLATPIEGSIVVADGRSLVPMAGAWGAVSSQGASWSARLDSDLDYALCWTPARR